jgi:hypothetical protein
MSTARKYSTADLWPDVTAGMFYHYAYMAVTLLINQVSGQPYTEIIERSDNVSNLTLRFRENFYSILNKSDFI